MLALFSLAVAAQPQVDPYLLDILSSRKAQVQEGWNALPSGRRSSLDEAIKAAEGYQFVLVGESHDNAEHHQVQADVIEALVNAGRDVSVGFEMFTRDNQMNLAGWTLGRWSQDEFIERSSWKTQWGFPYEIYSPIFEVVREHGLPMAALNLPRDWVRQVGRNGPDVLTPEQKKWAPDIEIGNKRHRAVFEAMIGGGAHGMPGTAMDNMYAAQVAWDESMAQSAVDFMSGRTHSKKVMVILAGSGHTMYGQAINYRLKKKGHDSLNITCISGGPRTVSADMGDFLYVSE